MALSTQEKQKIIADYKINDNDVGSSQVQIAILTADINKLQSHFTTNKKDIHSRRGLIRKVNLRRSLLKYLRKNKPSVYKELIARLGLRR